MNIDWKEEKIDILQLPEEDIKVLPADVAAGIKELIEPMVAYVFVQDNSARIELDNNCAFRRTLVLSNVSGLPQRLNPNPATSNEVYDIEFMKFSILEQGYSLSGELLFYDELDTYVPKVTMTFTEAHVETECYCATSQTFFDNPWAYLGNIALNICTKSTLPGNPCNALEQKLLPLLIEIANITDSWSIPGQYRAHAFPLLTGMANKHGYTKLLPVLADLEKEEPLTDKYDNRSTLLVNTLCQHTYEMLWRDIWNRIKESQKDYPDKVTLQCPADLLENTKASIQKLMEQHGYEGTYPDYVKKGPLRGIHLEESYNLTYWIAMEKDVTYYIHCSEEVDESDYLIVQFLCGTAMHRKGNTCEDIYSCLFNANGKRLFHTMHYDCKLPDSEQTSDLLSDIFGAEARPDNMEQCVQIAVKKNHLQRLTKEERKIYYGIAGGSFASLFFIIFIVGGVLFGAGMTVGFMVIEFLVTLIFGHLAQFPGLFMETPWWAIFLFCAVSYGGIMGLITILAKRK